MALSFNHQRKVEEKEKGEEGSESLTRIKLEAPVYNFGENFLLRKVETKCEMKRKNK